MTSRLTVGQALIRFLGAQWTEQDGHRQRLFAGVLGIFGHGNVGGVGQALLQHSLTADAPELPYVLVRNEQGAVHLATGFARQRRRLQTWACTTSIGPGATNMITGAALATTNRIPVLLLPSSTFATRVASPVLQELEAFYAADVTVNDAFRPVSRFFDNITRPEQLPSTLLAACRVLTDPVDTGAVTLSLPQDVQAEAFDWPESLFAQRVWHIRRTPPEAAMIARAARAIRESKRPLIVAGGGVRYSGAHDALAALCETTGIPVGETQAGKGSLLHGNPQLMGGIGATGTTAANQLALDADLVIGVGTRWSDFTTASRTLFQDKAVRFINLNVAGFDAGKLAGLEIVTDAREGLIALRQALAGYAVDDAYRVRQRALWRAWSQEVDLAYRPAAPAEDVELLAQSDVVGAVNEEAAADDVVVCAAGSMPGDLHKLWRVRESDSYHVEYAYSCMGYEIPAAIGVAMAEPDRDVFAMVGDGGYLMNPSELVTAVQEHRKIIVVLVQNDGFGSIGALSESLGSGRFGTRYVQRGPAGRLDGDPLPVDLGANAASLGCQVIEVRSRAGLTDAIREAKTLPRQGDSARPVVIHVRTDASIGGPSNDTWWEVPVAQVSESASTRDAARAHTEHKSQQRQFLAPFGTVESFEPSGEDES